MKNLKDSLYNWRKHWIEGLLDGILFTLPTIMLFLPIGNQSEYEINKWYVYAAIVGITLILNFIYIRLEDYETTIEILNNEIENLKTEIGELKNEKYAEDSSSENN